MGVGAGVGVGVQCGCSGHVSFYFIFFYIYFYFACADIVLLCAYPAVYHEPLICSCLSVCLRVLGVFSQAVGVALSPNRSLSILCVNFFQFYFIYFIFLGTPTRRICVYFLSAGGPRFL